jgi:hypothetical protein
MNTNVARAPRRTRAPRAPRPAQQLQSIELQSTLGEGLGTELHGEAERTHLAALVAKLAPGEDSAVVHLRVACLPSVAGGEGPPADSEPARAGRHRRRGEARRRAQVREGDRRVRALCRALERSVVGVGGPCVVVPLAVYTSFQRFDEIPRELPLPHRTGAGLAVWRHHSLRVLRALTELLVDAKLPQPSVWFWNGDSDRLRTLPDWLEVVSVRRDRVELRRTDA